MGYENWKVQWAPTSQPDDPFPAWEELTPWVETVGRPWSAQSGRASEFNSSQPGHLALTLNNTDHRFSDLKLARQIRVIETIGYRTFPIFRGWLELPDISDWAEAGADQFITVTAVDRLTRLDRSRRFISTLTEYIRYNGGTGLKAYYPLLESSGTIAYDKSAYGHEPMTPYYDRDSLVTPTQGGPVFTAGNGTVLPGDDLAGPTWSPLMDASGQWSETASPRVTWTTGATQSGSDTVTIAGWVTLAADPLPATKTIFPFALFPTNGVLWVSWSAGTGWMATGGAGGGPEASISFTGPRVAIPMLIAVRMNLVSQVVEVWRHSDPPLTATVTGGTLPTSVTWNEIWAGTGLIGTVTHVQVYVGGTSVYTRAAHLAQVRAGYSGLAGQTTGQRIRTIAGYAGVPASELSIDEGTVRMQNTSLAGKSPLTPMREAETTEQGLLLANGSGELVFQDRIHRYNI